VYGRCLFKITLEVRVPVDITGSYDAPERLHGERKTFLEVNGVEETAKKIEDGCRKNRLCNSILKGTLYILTLTLPHTQLNSSNAFHLPSADTHTKHMHF
jgi:hypothetical protein